MPGTINEQKISEIADKRINQYFKSKWGWVPSIGGALILFFGFLDIKKDNIFTWLFHDTVISMVKNEMKASDDQMKLKIAYTSQANFKIIPSDSLHNFYYLPFYTDTTRTVMLDVIVTRPDTTIPPTTVYEFLDTTSLGKAIIRPDFNITSSIHIGEINTQKIGTLHTLAFTSQPGYQQKANKKEVIDITCSIRVFEGKF
jgi:hypothetical protein